MQVNITEVARNPLLVLGVRLVVVEGVGFGDECVLVVRRVPSASASAVRR